jgi:hypothetical protein
MESHRRGCSVVVVVDSAPSSDDRSGGHQLGRAGQVRPGAVVTAALAARHVSQSDSTLLWDVGVGNETSPIIGDDAPV